MAGPIIKFVKVVKRFGDLTGLDELDFTSGRESLDFRPVGVRRVKGAAYPDDA
jgi:hypothetical protein